MHLDSKVWLGLMGPFALGAVLGLDAGVRAMGTQSLLLPALVLGLTLSLSPALYIGLSLAGNAPAAVSGLGALRQSLVSTGIVMAGLSPAVAFLVVTGPSGMSKLLGMLVSGGAVLIGMRQLFRGLVELTPDRRRMAVVFVPWMLIALALGADLFSTLLQTARRLG